MFTLKSQLRRKLLAFFFSNVTSAYHLRELARILAVDPTNLSRELRSLEQEGLFLVEIRGRQKIFRLNTHHSLFKELKTIIAKTVGVVGALREVFSKMPKAQLALLYGSFAKGDEDASSDVDVLLVGSMTFEDIADVIARLEKQLGREINVVHYTPREYVEKKRKKDPLLQSIFGGKYELLIGDI